jgi:hypothetical protein
MIGSDEKRTQKPVLLARFEAMTLVFIWFKMMRVLRTATWIGSCVS